MRQKTQSQTAAKSTSWAVAFFYLLIVFEFFYMASPFAIYFYSVYGPGLSYINSNPALAWLSSMFLPHIVIETSSPILNQHNVVGAILSFGGFLTFCIGAGQVYYYKLVKKGPVLGGIYNFIRHPQYVSLAICSFGLLLLWPRYIVLLSFVGMLFAYYFLAKIEEDECEEKFGEAYLKYKNKTNMFLPFRLPLIDKLPGLPKKRLKRVLIILSLYIISSIVAVGLTNVIRSWSLNSLYSLYSKDAVYVSIVKLDCKILERIVKIASENSDIMKRIEADGNELSEKYINYVLPAEMYVSEIPMHQVKGTNGNHFLPSQYDGRCFRIVFTKAELRAHREVEGKEILLNTTHTVPIVEVLIDLPSNKVIDIKSPMEAQRYENIPVPIF